MKVYDLEGNEHEKHSVDARECVEQGWTYERVEKKPAEDAPMTTAQIKAALEAAGVDIPVGAKKAELLALLPE